MNKLAGKELQSLPSQINAGSSEGAAATDPLAARRRAFISAPSRRRSGRRGKSEEGPRARGARGARGAALRLPGLFTLFKERGTAPGPEL